MALDRQFIVEVADAQGNLVARGSVFLVNTTGSRVTGTTAGAAASLVTWAGNGQSAVAGATVIAPAVRVLDANGLPVAGSTVTWEGNTKSGATQQGLTGTSDANGVVTLGGWSVGTTAGSAYTVFAYSGNLTNSPIRFSITPTAASAFSIGVSAGNSQASTPLSLLASRLTALVQDRYGNNVNGASVTWTSSAGDAAFGTTPGTTNSSGLVGTTYTTGQSASTESVWAAISSATSARFGVGVYAGAPTIFIFSGNDQTALSGTTLANPLIVSVEDAYGNPWGSGQTLQFVIVAGSGNVSNATLTPSNGTAAVTWKVGATAGLNQLEVSLQNISGSTVTFNASGTNPVADTIQIESGNNQTATVGTALALPLAVATLGSGSSASGQVVAFSATSGSLSTSATASSTSGIARTVWTMPTGVGTHTVTASAGTLSGSPLTFTATSTAGAATQLLLATQPSSTVEPGVAWTQQPVVVSADQYGNRVSTNTRVGAVLVSGDGTLASAVSTFAVASGATATFSGLSYTYASALDFQVAFRCNSLSTVTATGQTSQPPFANKLAFTAQPAGGSVNAGIGTITVAVQDALGATVGTATNAVTLALTPASNTEGATLSGTVTQNAVNGVATFTGLTVDTAGSYTLDASSTGLTGATSASFAVTAPGTAWPNLPAGYTTATDQTLGLARPAGTGWIIDQSTGNHVTLVTTETTEPISPSDALQVDIATNASGGGSFEHQSYSVNAQQWSELFLGCSFKLSSNFNGTSGSATASSGVQKLWHLWGYLNSGQNSLVVPTAFGTGTGFTLQLRCQNFHSSNPRTVSFNLTSSTAGTGQSTSISKGVWHRLEVQLIYNTGSNADGIARAWLDGVKVLEATNLVYNTTGSKRWYTSQLWPTHFNSGWRSTVDQTISFGHALIAGKA